MWNNYRAMDGTHRFLFVSLVFTIGHFMTDCPGREIGSDLHYPLLFCRSWLCQISIRKCQIDLAYLPKHAANKKPFCTVD